MPIINSLAFNTLTVYDCGLGSEKYLGKEVQGTFIEHGTEIMVGEFPFDLEIILENKNGTYKLMNSNETLGVEKT